MFPLIVSVLTVFIFLEFIPPSKEHCHWLKYLGFRVIVADFDVYGGVSMSVSLSLDEYVTPCIQYITSLTYIPL